MEKTSTDYLEKVEKELKTLATFVPEENEKNCIDYLYNVTDVMEIYEEFTSCSENEKEKYANIISGTVSEITKKF